MRILYVIFGLLALAAASTVIVEQADISNDPNALNKFLGGMGKIYDHRDNARRDKVSAAKKEPNLERKKGEIADIITTAVVQLREGKSPEHKMLNLHTLHAAEAVIKKEKKAAADYVHNLYLEHSMFFQNDTWVRGLIFGSLVVVFMVAAYQGVLTSRKFV